MACEQPGRGAFLMQVDAPYCHVIVQRREQFRGLKAQRECAGEEAAYAER